MANKRREVVGWSLVKAIMWGLLGMGVGCGDGGGGGDYDLPELTPPIITLFEDSFSSGTLGNWIVEKPSAIASAFGNPAPSLLLVGSASQYAAVGSSLTFSTILGLYMAVDVNPGGGNAAVTIAENTAAVGLDTYASIVDGSVLYSIGGTTMLRAYPATGGHHRYAFEVSSGMASWSRDGVVQLQVAYSTPARLRVGLQDLGGGTPGSRFDNVRVSLP